MNNMEYNKNMYNYKEFDKLYFIDWFDELNVVMCVCVCVCVFVWCTVQ